MNILTLTYIFILYILFISCLLYKQSGTYKITYALLFTIILYLTIDVVNQTKENYTENKIEINRAGVKDLVNNLEQQIDENILNVTVNKNVNYSSEQDNNGIIKICEEKIKNIDKYKQQIADLTSKIEKDAHLEDEVEKLRSMITKLNNKQMELYAEIDKLSNTLLNKDSIINDKDNMLYKLNNTITDLSGTIFTLDNYLDTKKTQIQNSNNEIDIQKDRISNLKIEINNNKQIINNKDSEISIFTDNLKKINGELKGDIHLITEENSDITQSDIDIKMKNNAITQLDTTMKNLKQEIENYKENEKQLRSDISDIDSEISQNKKNETTNNNQIVTINDSIDKQNKQKESLNKCRINVPKVELVKQLSSECCDCNNYKAFGIIDDNTMFVENGCAGIFKYKNKNNIVCQNPNQGTSSFNHRIRMAPHLTEHQCSMTTNPKYFLNPHKETWEWHKQKAASFGATLVSIHSNTENDEVRKIMGGGNVWIGGERTNINLDTIDINVGNSKYHIKNIRLPYDNMTIKTFVWNHRGKEVILAKPTNKQNRRWNDKFTATVGVAIDKDTKEEYPQLSVTRVDRRSGWGQNLQLQGHVKYSGTTSTYWKWADNSKWDYTNFKDNEPNTKTETKLQIQQTGKWNDAPPDTKIGAVYAL